MLGKIECVNSAVVEIDPRVPHSLPVGLNVAHIAANKFRTEDLVHNAADIDLILILVPTERLASNAIVQLHACDDCVPAGDFVGSTLEHVLQLANERNCFDVSNSHDRSAAGSRVSILLPKLMNSSGPRRSLCVEVAPLRVIQHDNGKLLKFHLVNCLTQ